MQRFAETLSRAEPETFARPGYAINVLNHSENANFMPYETYNKIGKAAGLLFKRQPEHSPDRPKES